MVAGRIPAKARPALRWLASVTGLSTRHFVLDALPKDARGAEVGVWRGDFSARLLRSTRVRSLILIDLWRFQPALPGAWYAGRQAQSQADMDAIAASVAKRFEPEIAATRVTIMRMDSQAAARSLPDGSLDWVYIDGNHEFSSVRDDLDAFLVKARPGGLFAGDDYGNPGWWKDGVTRAVMDFIRRTDTVVEEIHNGQFILRLPG